MNRITRTKSGNYTTISNVFLKDKNLSIKAKGFLAVIMGLPEDWDFTIAGICSILKEGKSAVYNVIQELKDNGYCQTRECRSDKGTFVGLDYVFREEPYSDTPHTNYPHTDFPDTDNPPQINTNINKDLNNKESISKDIPKKEKQLPFESEELRNLWEELVKYPEWQKKTSHAIDLRIKTLERLSKGNVNYAIAIVRQTLEKGWLDFYDVKDYKPQAPMIMQPRRKTPWEEMGITYDKYVELMKQ